MKKIDFFGGTHGNFLELVINVFVCQHPFDFTKPIFNDNGACHLKNLQYNYRPSIKSGHYSYFNNPFNHDDLVIEIHVDPDWMLASLTNSLLRAGDEVFDLKDLHKNSIKKLSSLQKATYFLKDLTTEHGIQENYPKNIIRNYFYSKFFIPEYGINLFNTFKSSTKKIVFPFSAFFSIEQFYIQLNQVAFFLQENFYPGEQFTKVFNEFILRNQGYHSQIKCNNIVTNILHNLSMDITDCNLVEQAWINYRIAQIFRCYDHPLLINEDYPTNTQEIAAAIYNWKSNDYPVLK
jgi:hypothetical protein